MFDEQPIPVELGIHCVTDDHADVGEIYDLVVFIFDIDVGFVAFLLYV